MNSHDKHAYKFSDFPTDDLRHWIRLRYIDQIPTIELIKRAKNHFQKEEIALVSLLDLDESTLKVSMPQQELEDLQVMHWRLIGENMLAGMQFSVNNIELHPVPRATIPKAV